MLLALVIRKAKYDGPDLKNYIPRSSSDREKKASNYLPSIGNPVIAIMSKSVRLIVVKRKMKPFMKVTQNPKKLNIRVVLTRMLC